MYLRCYLGIYIYLSEVGQNVAPIQGPSPNWNVLRQWPSRTNLRIRPQKWPQKFLIGIIIGTALSLNVDSAGEVGQDLGIGIGNGGDLSKFRAR